MSRILLISALTLLVSAPAQGALPEDCIQSSYPRRVIPSCTELLRQEPNNALAYFKRGKAYIDNRTDTRDVGRAIEDLTKAIAINQKYAEAHNQRGIAYQRNGDFSHAVADQTKAIEINPTLARAYHSRGQAYRQQRDFERAIAD
jgi:tetratricopeptide (TPR) repeat protein